MELRHLRYLVGVARELSFTKAAQKLRVAQPALSRQIRQLEDEVGVLLLERNRRAVRLTKAGQAFWGEAQSILDRSDQAIRVAQATDQAGRGQLNVGYVWGLFHSLAPAMLERFRAAFPGIAVNLLDMTATQQAAALVEGRLDLGFIAFAHEADEAGLAKRKIGTCSFVAALPKKHRAARKPQISLADLSEDFFLVISEQSYPGAARSVFEACARAGFRAKTLQTAERGYTILGLVADNCGVVLLPEPLRAMPHPGVVFRPLTEPPRGDLFVAWRTSHLSPMRDAFLDLL
ncbi:MAG: LysR family transcriptional regulator [Verrucomicrobia bacterium]|nr:LysR family transcriptional regulator [Verrucomicrobiota bacterium]